MKTLKFLPLIATGITLLAISCKKDTQDAAGNSQTQTDMLSNPTERAVVTSNFRNIIISTATYANKFNPEILYSDADVVDADADKIWVHIENGDAKTMYQPRDWKHVDNGDQATKYEFPVPKHVEDGLDKTLMVPTDWVHKPEGFDKTHYYPPTWEHIPEGDNKTAHRMDGYEHISTGPNKSYFKKP